MGVLMTYLYIPVCVCFQPPQLLDASVLRMIKPLAVYSVKQRHGLRITGSIQTEVSQCRYYYIVQRSIPISTFVLCPSFR